MKIELGNMKVVITSGLSADGRGCIKFEKSFEAFDVDRKSIYDVPVQIYFKNSASIDTVIRALEHIKKAMEDEK